MKIPKLPKDTEYYQDVWLNGKCVKKGIRDCETRYKIIKKELDKLRRPFRVLDIGSNMGYFGIRIKEDYPDVKVYNMEHNPEYQTFAREMFKLNKVQGSFNDGGLYRGVTLDVKPDIILFLSTLHWCLTSPFHILNELTANCPVILEIPTPKEIEEGPWTKVHIMLKNPKMFYNLWNTEQIGSVKSHLVKGVKRPIYKMERWRKLNVGCGDHYIKGYLGIDLHMPEDQIDLRDDGRTLSKITDSSIDELYCSHMLIYVHPYEWKEMFRNWYRVLRVGGKLILEYPLSKEEWEVIKHIPEPNDIMDMIKDMGFIKVKEVPTRKYSKFYGKKAPLYAKWLKGGKKGKRPDYHNVTIQGVRP